MFRVGAQRAGTGAARVRAGRIRCRVVGGAFAGWRRPGFGDVQIVTLDGIGTLDGRAKRVPNGV